MNKKIIYAIKHYKENHMKTFYTWLDSFYCEGNLKKTIERAVLSRGINGRKHPHQQRLNNTLLKKHARKLLRKIKKIEALKDFNELYDEVKGIGDLVSYDIALRIAYFMWNRKVKLNDVYLQSDAKKGAREVLNLERLPRKLPLSKFPDEFHGLKAIEVEDILCIYKKYFTGEKKLNEI